MPLEGGVLEYGNTDDDTTASWGEMPPSAVELPSWHLHRAFEEMGACYALLWHVADDGATLKVAAGYTVDAWRSKRADGRTFESESRQASVSRGLERSGKSMVALALRTGVEHFRHDAQSASSEFTRADIALEFGIKVGSPFTTSHPSRPSHPSHPSSCSHPYLTSTSSYPLYHPPPTQRIYFTPIRGTSCVLECGVPAASRLEGQSLLATLQMRCDLADAACAWGRIASLLYLPVSRRTSHRKEPQSSHL